MNKLFYRFILPILIVGVFTFSCKDGDNAAPILSVSVSELSIPIEGFTSEFTVISNEKWRMGNSGSSWLQVSQVSGNGGTYTIELSAGLNETSTTRIAILTITSDNGQSRRVTCSQPSKIYPSYNTSPIPPDATGMSSTAVELAAKMQMGINFGNTMESPNEGDWQTSKLTESYVKFVKQIGFNAVRLPTGWVHSHLSDPTKAKIDTAWLNRVKEVVGWCVANDMYVILNAHGDWGWLEDNVNKKMQDSINAKQKAIWEQIATTMRDFDEHLIFAGTNEPKADNAEQMSILNSYHQTFIDAVRATGGRNSYRVLVVQGPHTDCFLTYDLMNTLPTDNVPNKMMVEIHDYTPATFTLLTDGDVSWGKMVYYWGAGNYSTIEPDRNATFGEEDMILSEFQKMKQKFVDKGIPVMLGEYATWRRTASTNQNFLPKDLDMHNKSVDYWATYVTKQAKANGIVPFWWEIGFMLDRANNVVKDQALLDAIMEGGK
jgi:endoglucanase